MLYEVIIASTLLSLITSYPTLARGIIVKYALKLVSLQLVRPSSVINFLKGENLSALLVNCVPIMETFCLFVCLFVCLNSVVIAV